MSYTYRLELCPTSDGVVYYKEELQRDNTNAGVDLFISKEYDAATLQKNENATLLDLGTAARMVRVWPDGCDEDVHFWLCPRSSIFKTGIMMANSQGVIDASYRGTLKAPVWVVAETPFISSFVGNGFEGMRLFQIVAPDMGWIKEVRIVNELSDTVRGNGGFGSTGR